MLRVFRLSRRPRAQALIELTFSLPVLVMLFFGTFQYWVQFSRQQTFTTAAQTLGEWVSRTGVYTEQMRDVVLDEINQSAVIGPNGAYLYIRVIEPDGDTYSIGTAPPSAVTGTPLAPAEDGWDDTGIITGAPIGSEVLVDIWGYHRIAVPPLPVDFWTAPVGHKVVTVIQES